MMRRKERGRTIVKMRRHLIRLKEDFLHFANDLIVSEQAKCKKKWSNFYSFIADKKKNESNINCIKTIWEVSQEEDERNKNWKLLNTISILVRIERGLRNTEVEYPE